MVLVSSCCRPKYVNLFEWLHRTIGKMAPVLGEPPFFFSGAAIDCD